MTNVSGSMFSCMRDVLLFGCVVIPQGSGTAKYNGCSPVPHSELMKSGPAQEEPYTLSRVWWLLLHCSGSDCQTNKVRGEWIQNIMDSTRRPAQGAMCQNSIKPFECDCENKDYNYPMSQWGHTSSRNH